MHDYENIDPERPPVVAPQAIVPAMCLVLAGVVVVTAAVAIWVVNLIS